MRNALKISAGLHALLIVASLVSIPWFDRDEEETIRVAQVSILTESQFDAAVSQAPQTVPMTTLDALAAPGEENLDAARPDAEMDVTINELDGPDAPTEADAQADLSAVLTTNRVTVDDEVTTLAPELPGAFDTALNSPVARPEPRPESLDRPAGMSPPRPQAPSLRIDTAPAAAPPEDVRTADETQEEIRLSTEGTTDLPPQEATAPEEAATEIIPEIAEDLPEPEPTPLDTDPLDADPLDALAAEPAPQDDGAPLASVRPQARPEIREPVTQPVRTVETTEQPAEPVEPAASTPDQPPAVDAPERQATSIPQGPPLTSGEIGNLTSAISSKWNVGRVAGLEGGDQLVVTVGITLDRSGRVVGDVRPIRPSSPDGAYALAFSVARSAIMQASNAGAIILPVDKYGQWQEIEITFDPSKTVVGFGS
ncbi:hypothetical protein [Pontivivens nitratireducens]|uniref:hypothetical protein n=1 Tax=Pontivivens nitratireducens TaxID=2758038 RepID=UPI00163B3615|nr:hypothetical protein [Pontibrevibacter nitratireducens]